MGPVAKPAPEIAVMMLARFAAADPMRALRLLAFGKHRLTADPRVRFFKCLGSGHGGGFTLKPSLYHLGLFATFDTDDDAEGFVGAEGVRSLVTSRAEELLVCRMRAVSMRGAWDGRVPCVVSAMAPERGPIAAITRASIQPSRAAAFWRHAAPAQAQLRQAAGCLAAAGLGEAPLLRQATFTIWRSAADMAAFARTAQHGAAAQAALRERYFSEDMFARFKPHACVGTWQGRELPCLAART